MKYLSLEIEKCVDCPYLDVDWMNGDDYCNHSGVNRNIISDTMDIPKWCPLTDRKRRR